MPAYKGGDGQAVCQYGWPRPGIFAKGCVLTSDAFPHAWTQGNNYDQQQVRNQAWHYMIEEFAVPVGCGNVSPECADRLVGFCINDRRLGRKPGSPAVFDRAVDQRVAAPSSVGVLRVGLYICQAWGQVVGRIRGDGFKIKENRAVRTLSCQINKIILNP